jgi:hypothetical protein
MEDPWNDDEPARPVVPQSLLNAVSVVLVLALILGSAGAVVALLDQSADVAILVGLAIALTLLFGWFTLRSWAARRQGPFRK